MSEGPESGRVLSDEERARAVREQLKSLHAFDLAYEMMVSLVSFGYQKLGLTGETAELRNLDDAHYAIELLGALLKVSDREHPVSDLRDLHATLAQMQLGYVQALELEGRAPAAEVPDEAGPGPEAGPAEGGFAAPPETPSEAEAEAAHEATPEEVEEHLAENEAFAEEAAAPPRPARKPAAKESAGGGPAAKKAGAGQKKTATRKPAARKKPAPKPDDQG